MPLKTSWVRICMRVPNLGSMSSKERRRRARRGAAALAPARRLLLRAHLGAGVLDLHLRGLGLVVRVRVDHAVALDLAEHRDVGGDGLVVALAERLGVG